MRRVLSLGLILPQSTPNALQSFRILKWDQPLQYHKSHRVLPTSDLTVKVPEPLGPRNANQGQESEEEEGDQRTVIPRRGWKENFYNQEFLRKRIRPLRPDRPPPKYAYNPELPRTPGEPQEIVPRIYIHPLHRGRDAKGKDGMSVSFLENILPVAASTLPDQQSHTRQDLKRRSRDALLYVIATTHSISEAFEAYETLLSRTPRPVMQGIDALHTANQHPPPIIPYRHLHRLARLLSTTHPRTRSLFLRLLSVITTLRDTGGTVFVWEWNALIDCAGKGWRKTTMDDYRSALGIFKDMVISGQKAAASRYSPIDAGQVAPDDARPVAQPDIVSFTTLLDIASRSLSENAINHATSLLDASELPWNHVTHMAKLNYYIRTRQLEHVRGILREAVGRGLDLPTLNGCLWAYARSGQLRVALQVYELMRRNIPLRDRIDFGEVNARSDPPVGEDDRTENPILSIPRFTLPDTICPDKVTYGLLVQAMCYHGDFIGAMRVFRDMVSTVDPATKEPRHHPVGRPPKRGICFKPSTAVYRAIFLGFARHAHKKRTLTSSLISKRRNIDIIPLSEFAARLTPSDPGTPNSKPREQPEPQTHWTLKNLDMLFESFLENGYLVDYGGSDGLEGSNVLGRPSDRMIYWIMVAYAKTTSHDIGKLYKVWRELDARFGSGSGVRVWSGRIALFAKELEARYKKSHVVKDDGPEIDPKG